MNKKSSSRSHGPSDRKDVSRKKSASRKGVSPKDSLPKDLSPKVAPRDRAREVRPTDQPPEGAKDSNARPRLSFHAKKRGRPPAHLADFTIDKRREWAQDLGLPAFRANQLSDHYFAKAEAEPTLMTDLPKALRETEAPVMLPQLVEQASVQSADGGDTIKQLWRLYDGALIESVLMKYPDRVTLCLSSEVGCGMACPFCATGQMGLTRNLSAAEMTEQVRLAKKACESGVFGQDANLTNIVFMGMGEPLANFGAVKEALHRILDEPPEGFGMSARNITVSTVGLVPGINRLADLGLPVTLAVSLHAPDNDLRDELIPINSRWNVHELLDAARAYFVKTGRRVSIEYALIKDMNDQPWRAELLAEELNKRGRGWAHVNPIPLNPTPGTIWTASSRAAQDEFVRILRREGIRTTVRDTRGADIDGACGQLATNYATKSGA